MVTIYYVWSQHDKNINFLGSFESDSNDVDVLSSMGREIAEQWQSKDSFIVNDDPKYNETFKQNLKNSEHIRFGTFVNLESAIESWS